ncbi:MULTISPECIES: esterase/lipase family protein [Pacificibacter]|uniref:esterase/lipase family protein n=1 Tax=Pacificibacter TaxID=1042323 RepID=UPI0020910160|nr:MULTISPECIES: alpha/beta hydrolase [Pacificibacter]MDO6615750.1 alpha/beta hydrolase [Pacificibacter sp. 1_MG-2023]
MIDLHIEIMKKPIVFALFSALTFGLSKVPVQAEVTPTADARACVILLHGLARTKTSMMTLERSLIHAGFDVVNQGYPSRSATIEALAETALTTARQTCADDTAPDVVTHSMGGILLRSYAQAHPKLDWGRVVMLAPPNHGSGIIDEHGDRKWFQLLNGPAAEQLKTGGLPDHLPPVPFEAGIIAGSQSLNPATSALVEGIDDGKVSIESTKVAGMRAHITLPVTHTFMMHNPKVMAQTLMFLKTGRFEVSMTTVQAVKYLKAGN